MSNDQAPAVFVAGPENEIAVPALQRLLAGEDLSDLGLQFNPLVLVGPTGLGKSHLCRGVLRQWRKHDAQAALEYFTASDFARQLRDSRDANELEDFRQHVSSLQLLVIEDLHRLSPRPFVQRELRDVLDVLIDAEACVIVTSQQSPLEIPNLDPGLCDRLMAGLTLHLQPPGIEARRQLLALSASGKGISLDEAQLDQMAARLEGTVPQLLRAISEYSLNSQQAQLPVQSQSPLKLRQIIAVVARYFSVTQAALCSSARRKTLVYARGVVAFLARQLTELSYSQIGQALGRRDHSTIMHASRTIESRIASDTTTRRDIEELKRILTAT